jgi:DeoR family deoxyribose operon repressor
MIVGHLRNHRSSDVKELSGLLYVSEMTVRRDLKVLEDRNIIKLLHGGVFLNSLNPAGVFEDEYTLPAASAESMDEKKRIAQKAVSLIDPGESVTIDSGSTTELFARLLPMDVRLNILCYSLNVLNEVIKRKNSQIICAGGLFHERSLMFESPEGLSLIRRTRTNKAFISASGANAELGVTTKIQYEREVKEAIMESSQIRILLIDSTKFGKVQTNYFANLEDFEIVITDTGIPEDYIRIINDLDIQLHVV